MLASPNPNSLSICAPACRAAGAVCAAPACEACGACVARPCAAPASGAEGLFGGKGQAQRHKWVGVSFSLKGKKGQQGLKGDEDADSHVGRGQLAHLKGG